MNASPAVASRKPIIMLIDVDLPAPFGPSSLHRRLAMSTHARKPAGAPAHIVCKSWPHIWVGALHALHARGACQVCGCTCFDTSRHGCCRYA